MFRSTKEPEEAGVRPQEHQITGLERAKLERHDHVVPAHPAPVLAPPPAPRAALAPAAPAPAAPAPVAPVQDHRPAAPVVQVQERRPAAPVVQPPRPAAPTGGHNIAQMIAGAGVTVKGDMQCDMLRVEGNIEGNVKARKLEISAGGALLGTADIEDAEIEGRFEGTLSVAGLLIVRSTGRVSGKFHYGNIEIERGGTISGEVQAHGSEPLNHAANTVASAPKPANITPSDDTKSLRNTAFGRS